MKAWHYPLLWVALTAILGVLGPASTLTADEVDSLAAGSQLADHLLDGGERGLGERVKAGFAADERNPRAAAWRSKHLVWHRELAEPPSSRWVTALGVAVVPAESSYLRRAAWVSAACQAGAIVLVLWIAGSFNLLAGLFAAAVMLLLPGSLDAAGGAGSAALGALLSAALAAIVHRMTFRRKGELFLLLGLVLGLLFGWHPGTFFLLIPFYAAIAIGRPYEVEDFEDERPGDGELPLPQVPLGIFAAPVLGLIILVLLFPPLWENTGKGLASWLTDTWHLHADTQTVAGVTFNQAAAKAPHAWSAFAQFSAVVPITILIAWLAGIARTTQLGRKGPWYALLAVATVLVIGGIDGSLWGQRLTLVPLLWAPVAITAGLGAHAIVRWLRRRLSLSRPIAIAACAVVLLTLPLVGALTEVPTGPTHALGASARHPTSLSLLEQMAGAKVHIGPDKGNRWDRTLDVLAEHGGADVRFATLRDADWLIVVGTDDALEKDRGAPTLATRAAGVPIKAWKLK